MVLELLSIGNHDFEGFSLGQYLFVFCFMRYPSEMKINRSMSMISLAPSQNFHSLAAALRQFDRAKVGGVGGKCNCKSLNQYLKPSEFRLS
mmetsp:Transcript_5014/g.10811  ORF Transcript_5014/g.10811 Transcript_5014/m.10811 type:complete len:91 (-) Transcript_5014:87-359(-)